MGNLRITGGALKGRRIRTLRGLYVRPTADRVREAVFSMVSNDVDAALVLDLFAGSGALGIEALSRGASKVVFVERHFRQVRVIRENLSSLGVPMEKWDVVKMDARDFLRGARRKEISYDVVLMDPPYGDEAGDQSLILLDRGNLVKIGGIVVLETARGKIHPALDRLVLEKKRGYGDTEILIFRLREGSHETYGSLPGDL